MCGVWVSSQPLLEAHFKGRRHLKRALEQADADATNMGLQPGTAPDTASVPRSVPLLPALHCCKPRREVLQYCHEADAFLA